MLEVSQIAFGLSDDALLRIAATRAGLRFNAPPETNASFSRDSQALAFTGDRVFLLGPQLPRLEGIPDDGGLALDRADAVAVALGGNASFLPGLPGFQLQQTPSGPFAAGAAAALSFLASADDVVVVDLLGTQLVPDLVVRVAPGVFRCLVPIVEENTELLLSSGTGAIVAGVQFETALRATSPVALEPRARVDEVLTFGGDVFAFNAAKVNVGVSAGFPFEPDGFIGFPPAPIVALADLSDVELTLSGTQMTSRVLGTLVVGTTAPFIVPTGLLDLQISNIVLNQVDVDDGDQR
jgi:hypothetical protein